MVTLTELDRDPHPLLGRLRQTEPVAWVDVLGGWLVTRYDLALEVMRDPERFTVDDERFSTAQIVGPSMLSLDGEAHALHRAPFVASYRPTAVRERFEATIRQTADELIDLFVADGAAELRRAFAGPLAATTMARALGLERHEVAQLLAWYDAIVAGVTEITAGGGDGRAGRSAFAQLRQRLGPESAGDKAVLLFGGIETTEGMIANAILHLLEHAQDARQPLEDVLEESLRFEPAASVIDRYATAHTELGGVQIRERDLVRISIAGANRDPSVFEDPDRFDPRRPNVRRHLAFAQGPHVCLGVHLARLEARIALQRLIERLPQPRLDPERPPRVRGLVFRKPRSLDVLWG